MKRLMFTAVLLLIGLGTSAIVAIGLGLDKNRWKLPIGYYAKYNLVQRILEGASCFARIDDSQVREKAVLEFFSFTVSTKSDWKVSLWTSSFAN